MRADFARQGAGTTGSRSEAPPEAHGVADLLDGVLGTIDTLAEMFVQDQRTDGIDTGANGHELGDDVLAGAVVAEHLADAADLAFDTSEAGLDLVGGWLLGHENCSYVIGCRPV